MNNPTLDPVNVFGTPEYIAAQPPEPYHYNPCSFDPFIEFRAEAGASIRDLIKGLQRIRLRNDRWHLAGDVKIHLFS